eukprot:5271096-Prymnesium_polylepis.1
MRVLWRDCKDVNLQPLCPSAPPGAPSGTCANCQISKPPRLLKREVRSERAAARVPATRVGQPLKGTPRGSR